MYIYLIIYTVAGGLPITYMNNKKTFRKAKGCKKRNMCFQG